MEIVHVSFEELNKYRLGEPATKITDFYAKIMETMPLPLKEEAKYRSPSLDYFTNSIDLPEFTIPFCFSSKNASPELENYLYNFVILVQW